VHGDLSAPLENVIKIKESSLDEELGFSLSNKDLFSYSVLTYSFHMMKDNQEIQLNN